MKLIDFDIVYISYDEPNAEENYMDLVQKIPKAKRVHGVKGFDLAHRNAGSLAQTQFVLIIDGDNKIVLDLLDEDIDESLLNKKQVVSYSAYNNVNGLIYGNGGVKLWPKELLMGLDCHDSHKSTDWCYQVPYFQMNDWLSYSYCHASSYQAFRTGFREGVKLTLNSEGNRFDVLNKTIQVIPETNRRRLISWMSVGADVVNGYYCMYGARLGFLKSVCESDFNINVISDFEWISNYWNTDMNLVQKGIYQDHFEQMGRDIRKITGLKISSFTSEQSECVKHLVYNPKRSGLMNPKLSESNEIIGKGVIQKEH